MGKDAGMDHHDGLDRLEATDPGWIACAEGLS